MFAFRKVALEATEQLVQLWIDTFTQAYEDVHSAENIHAYCTQNFTVDAARDILSNEQFVCCIVTKNEQPVGFYVVKHHPCPVELDGASSELKQIYILASEYGTGLDKALFEHASDMVRSAGRNWLWLCVSSLNFRAQAFYQKLLFKPLDSSPTFDVGTDQLSSTVMIRRL